MPPNLKSHTIQKRAFSEVLPDDDSRQSKKHRKELEILTSDDKTVAKSNIHNDSKKKRKKRKRRKSPLTNPDIEIHSFKQVPKSMITEVPISVASSSTLSEVSLLSATAGTGKPLVDHNVLRTGSPVTEADQRPTLNAVDKGKGRATLNLLDNFSPAQGCTKVAGPSCKADPLKEAQAQIAELSTRLQCQKMLLSRYEDNLSLVQQSLTCEICLDLLYKPFSLSPCGHVACYMCLIRWFTSIQSYGDGGNDQYDINPPVEFDDISTLLNSRAATCGAFLRNRKTCPLCRASITTRPAEVWTIKSMVVNLIKSNLVNLPSVLPASARDTPGADTLDNSRNDPWRNVFPKHNHQHHHQSHFYPQPIENNERDQEWDIEDIGLYDVEDGGIYRCLGCMHEIWGGVCTNCNREYSGHPRFGDDDSDDDNDDNNGFHNNGGDGFFGEDGFLGGNVRRIREMLRRYNEPTPGWGPEDDGDDDDDVNLGEFSDAHPVELTDDESVSNEGSDQGPHTADEGWTTEEENGISRRMPTFGGPPSYDRSEPVAHIEETEDEEDEENDSESELNRSHPDSEVDYEGSVIDDVESGHEDYQDHDYGEDDDDDDGWNHRHYYGGYEDEPDDAGYGSMAGRLDQGLRLGGAGSGLHPLTVHGLGSPHQRRSIDDDGEDNDDADPLCPGPSGSGDRTFLDSEDEDEIHARLWRRSVLTSGVASDRRHRPKTRLYDDDESE